MKNEIKRAMHKTPLHYSYHAKSYSKQAREMSDLIMSHVNCGSWSIKEAFHFFSISYRPSIIRNRACNRFKRYLKNGKINKN